MSTTRVTQPEEVHEVEEEEVNPYQEEEDSPHHQGVKNHFKLNVDWYWLQWLHVMTEGEREPYYAESEELLTSKPNFVYLGRRDRRPATPFLLFSSEIREDHFPEVDRLTPEVLK